MFKPISHLTWAEVDAMNRAELHYVLPISALEQHGRHLPLGTDDLILQTALEDMYKQAEYEKNFLVLPTLHYGNSPEHMGFTGTLSLGVQTIAAVVEDVLNSMRLHKVRHLVILNSHGGNAPLFNAYAQEWAQKYPVRIRLVSFFCSSFFNGAAPLLTTPLEYEIHAGELETSLLMDARPELVKEEEISPQRDVKVHLQEDDPSWNTHTLSPGNGVLGCASCARPQTGTALRRYILEQLLSSFKALDEEP